VVAHQRQILCWQVPDRAHKSRCLLTMPATQPITSVTRESSLHACNQFCGDSADEGSFQALGGLLPGVLALRSAYGVLCGGWQKGADRLICGPRTGLAGPSLETQMQEVLTTPVPSYITSVDCKCTAIVSSLHPPWGPDQILGSDT